MGNDTEKNKEGLEGPKQEKKVDILDDIRAVENAVRRAMLIKMMSEIKAMAKQRLELAAKCSALLSAMGISAEDTKRIIDFVNNLSSVELSDTDKDAIVKWAKDLCDGKVKETEKKLEENFKFFAGNSFSNGNGDLFKGGLFKTSNGQGTGDPVEDMYRITCQAGAKGNGAVVFCSDAGDELKIRL